MKKSHQNLEHELKFEVKDINKIRDLLIRLDGKRKRVYEKTIMFDNKEKLMQTTNGRVRVRIRKPGKSEFSYKRPIYQKGMKTEIEYETEVEDWEALIAILKEMGFEPTTSYERYRTTYNIGGCKVTLDEYPFATFLEIEGESQKIQEVAKTLGFDPAKSIDKPCDTLYTEWRLKQGKPPKAHMLFDDY